MSDVDLGLGITAQIGEQLTTINLTEKGKNLPGKVINTTDFVKVISSISNENQREESPLFPADYGTKKMIKNNNDYYFLITTPPGRKEIQYSKLSIEELYHYDEDDYESSIYPGEFAYESLEAHLEHNDIYINERFSITPYLPSLVWFIQVRYELSDNTYRFVKDRIYSKDSVILSMKDKVYPAPLSNIYANDRVCWGDVQIPKLTIPGLMAIERIFFNVYSNMDLESTSTKKIDIDGYKFKAKFLHLLENESIYNTQGKESAVQHMTNLIKEVGADHNETLEEVWDEFTR